MTYAGKQRLVELLLLLPSTAAVTAATQFTFTVRKKGGASNVCVKGNSLALKPIDFSKMVLRLNFFRTNSNPTQHLRLKVNCFS